MRIILDSAIFNVQSSGHALALADLFASVARDVERHALLTDPPYILGGQNGQIDVWLSSRHPHEAQAFRAQLSAGLLVSSARPMGGGASDSISPRRWHLEGVLTIRVELRPDSDWQGRIVTVEDAAALLREPLHLVLENSRTDLAFLTVLAGPTNGATLRTLVDEPGRIVVHGGGGGETKKWIEALAATPPTAGSWRRLLRTWVLFDRDSGAADARALSTTANDIIASCEDVTRVHGVGLSWICLLRREIESYVPDNGLLAEATATQAAFVQDVIAWRADPSLAANAWTIDLKKGLRGDLRATLPEAVRDDLKKNVVGLAPAMLKVPFSALPAADVLRLEFGLGGRLADALRATPPRAWAPDLPAEYDRGPQDQAPRQLLVQSLFDRM